MADNTFNNSSTLPRWLFTVTSAVVWFQVITGHLRTRDGRRFLRVAAIGELKAWARAWGLRRIELVGGPLDGRRVRWSHDRALREPASVAMVMPMKQLPVRWRRGAWRQCRRQQAETVARYVLDLHRLPLRGVYVHDIQHATEATAHG